MEFLELYKEENRDILYSMSWLNKNSIFDKSIGSFQDIDLFTFLQNVNQFDYKKDTFYDDVYYILEYTHDTIFHLIQNTNKEIKRKHRVLPISQAREFDNQSVLWISRQNGRTLKEKLSKGKVKAVQRYKNVDTYENRIFKILLKKLLSAYEVREDLSEFDRLFFKIRRWLRSDDANAIDEYGKIVYNNILLHHPHYSKIFKSYKWFNSLNEKFKQHQNIYPSQVLALLTFEVLSKLQFSTNTLLLPSDLGIKYDNFKINFNENCLPENIFLEKNLKNLKIKSIDDVCFTNVVKLANDVVSKQLNIRINQNRTFKMIDSTNEVFIDLFRLFPIAFRNKQIIKFPITLKQKINNKIVNANNTKIIDLNNDIYTLPEIFSSYDTDVLKYFLEDFTKYFKESKLNYVIPDYVNIFEFTQSKRMINSYFKHNKPIPKSILAGIKHIFEKSVKKGDTLISIQRSPTSELFVTPLLVKYDKKLLDITNGFFLERYPTKKIDDTNSDILNSLNKTFDKDTSTKLLNKFLQNGIKDIKNENIVFYQADEIIDLNNFDTPKAKYNSIDINKIKNLYDITSLFNGTPIFLDDKNEENLINFQKLLQYEADGYNLWREHLPDLSMEIVRSGYFDQFILVNEKSDLIDKSVLIKEHFIIPKELNELSFPLKFGDEKINYKAYLASKEFPYPKNMKCTLNLTYDYERENPYELVFKPLDNKFKNIYVEWKKEKLDDEVLPIPNYPLKLSWNELENFQNKNKESVNLLEWIGKDFDKIIDIACFYSDKCESKRVYIDDIYFDWWKDKKGYHASKINLPNIGEVFFHEKAFDTFNKRIYSASFEIEPSDRGGYRALNVSAGKSLSQNTIGGLQKSIRFPLYTIWKDGRTLSDLDVPDNFRNLAYQAIQSSLLLLSTSEVHENLKYELFRFLSVINQDSDEKIFNTLLSFSKKEETFKKYFEYFGYAIGCKKREIQVRLWKTLISKLDFDDEKIFSNSLKAIGIVMWRCESTAYQLTEHEVSLILEKLYISLDKKIKEKNKFLKYKTNELRPSIVIRLELLLGVLRSRLNNDNVKNILSPSNNIIKKYIQIIDSITKKMIKENIELKSRIELHIDKPELFDQTPDLLFALRVYLSGDTGAANSIKVLGVSDD